MVEHSQLEDDHWWACHFPERPAEKYLTHFRRGCARCLPAFVAFRNQDRFTPAWSDGDTGLLIGDVPDDTAALEEYWFAVIERSPDG